MLQEQIDKKKDDRQLQRVYQLKRENEMLKQTLAQIKDMENHSRLSDVIESEDVYLRKQYFEALKRADMQRQNENPNSKQLKQNKHVLHPNDDEASYEGTLEQDYQTPDDLEEVNNFVYGTEKDTASANYRPGKSEIQLRKPLKNDSHIKKSSIKPVSDSLKSLTDTNGNGRKSSQKQFQLDQESFKISQIYSDKTQNSNIKNKTHFIPVQKSNSHYSINGSDDRDFNYLGSEENDFKDKKVNQIQLSENKTQYKQKPKDKRLIENLLVNDKSDKQKASNQKYDPSKESISKQIQKQEEKSNLKIKHQTDYQGNIQALRIKKNPDQRTQDDLLPVFLSSEDRSSQLKIKQEHQSIPKKYNIEKKDEYQIRVTQNDDSYNDYKERLVKNLQRKISTGPSDPITPEKRPWNSFSSRSQRHFNPLKEQYLDFMVKLNTYQADETDLNMSPEGKRRREIHEDFERAGQHFVGSGKDNFDLFAQKFKDESLKKQQTEKIMIELY